MKTNSPSTLGGLAAIICIILVFLALPLWAVSPETAAWISSVQALDGGVWSQADIDAVDKLVVAVNADSILTSAKSQKTLLVAPFRGPNAASRRRCLYHPSGVTVALAGALGDSSYTADGLQGDGVQSADTLYDGTGLKFQNITMMVHGRNLAALGADPAAFLVYGSATKVGATSGFYHKQGSNWLAGCPSAWSGYAVLSGTPLPEGTVGFVSGNSSLIPLVSAQYRFYGNQVVLYAPTTGYTPTWAVGTPGTNTYKLLSDGTNGCKATIQTFVMAPALPESNYLAFQAALADSNSDRVSYSNVPAVTTPRRIWIFAGQSNCSGVQVNPANTANGSVFNSLDSRFNDAPHPNILQWGRVGYKAGKAVPAAHPMDFRGTPTSTGLSMINVGPALSFAKCLLDQNSDQQILIIPAAVGATGFSSNNWNPGNPEYEAMLAMTNAALAEGGEIEGMVWNQGEGDTSLSAKIYSVAWQAMFNDFCSRVTGGWPQNAVVIYGELAGPSKSSMSSWFINDLVSLSPRRAFATKAMSGVDLLSVAEGYDDASQVHYSAKSQRLMGKSYAMAADSLARKVLSDWKTANNITDLTAAPAGDGLPNLLKFAFNMKPSSPGSNPVASAVQHDADGHGYLTIKYPRRKNSSGVTYTLEFSTDLSTWTSGSFSEIDIAPAADGLTEVVTARFESPIDTTPRMFARVRVTQTSALQ